MERFQTSATSRRTVLATIALLAMTGTMGSAVQAGVAGSAPGGYAPVDGHDIYFEDHGAAQGGIPIVLLHGGVMSIDTAFPELLPRFGRTRRVIAIEQQGHGHTADRPGPITIERMVADTAGVLAHLGIERADFFGHSLGGMIATGMAIRHPGRVRSAIALSAGYSNAGMLPEILAMNRDPTHQPSPELVPLLPTRADFAAWQASYARNAPDPSALQTVLGKLNRMLAEWSGWRPQELASIRAAVLLGIGDHDFFLPEHLAEMARLIPGAQLAILPGTTHMTMLDRVDWLVSMTEARIASA